MPASVLHRIYTFICIHFASTSNFISQRTGDERQKAAEAERLQLEMEEKKAWEALQLAQEQKAELCQILENERQEVERKAEEMKLEAERAETEKVAEEER